MKTPSASVTAASAVVFGILSIPTHADTPHYAITVLANLGIDSFAVAINSSGQVVGNSTVAGSIRAVRWTEATPTDLGEFIAAGINNSGQVVGNVGSGWGTGTGSHAVRWNAPGNSSTLYPFGNGSSAGNAINDSGVVAGGAYLYSFTYFNYFTEAIRWTGGANVDESLGINTYGHGINASGQVVGWGNYAGGSAPHAQIWTGSAAMDLGTLGGANSYGYNINNSGQVAGYAHTLNNGAYHAARWTGTTALDLGTLGGTNSFGYGINSSGAVTGMSQLAGDESEAPFLYIDGTIYDLNDLLLPGLDITGLRVDSGGNSINDLGQIAAFGYIGENLHAFRLDPVAAPEPATTMLLFAGMAFIGSRRRR